MQDFMMTLITCSVTMSALALIYMAVMPILAKFYSVRGCYYAWLIVILGLIIPFRPQFNYAVVRLDLPLQTELAAMQMRNTMHDGGPAAVPLTQLPAAGLSISRWQVLMIVWLTGVVISLVYQIVKYHRFTGFVRRWSEDITDETVLSVLAELKAEMSISRVIRVHQCAGVGGPMLTGFICPRILLPRIGFSADELRFILTHELVHYKRKDLWYKALVILARAVHWFNPVIYLSAKAVEVQCELSCDHEVIRHTDAGTRLRYTETIIGVVKYQMRLKTALSTNFYGGKNGMKRRIGSIMDMSKRKAGIAVIGSVMILTMGTGLAFGAKAETQNRPELIKEDLSYSYGFLPDPEVYVKYSAYGIALSEDGKQLLYHGQRVRLFADEQAETEAFYFDEQGTANLAVTRDSSGHITGVTTISGQEAQEYYSAFFADDLSTADIVHSTAGQNKYEQYSAYGITSSADGSILYYNGQRIKLLVDEGSDGFLDTFWTDDVGTVNLSVVRGADGVITGIERISEEKAQKYDQVLDEIDNKVNAKMMELFPEQ